MVEENALNGWENLFQTIKFEKLKGRKRKKKKTCRNRIVHCEG